MLKTLLLISAVITLSACGGVASYKYAPMREGLFNTTGYDAVQVDSNTYRVIFYGLRNTSVEIADRYSFYRAAELTIEKSFDYYVVLQTGDDDKMGDAWNIIRMFKGQPPESDLATFDARTVVRDMAPYIQRDDEGANK
jgi:hypothetical protein